MAFDRGAAITYVSSGATGGMGYVGKELSDKAKEGHHLVEWATRFVADASDWSALEQVSVACMTLGAAVALVRMVIDISGAVQRNREHKARIDAIKSGVLR